MTAIRPLRLSLCAFALVAVCLLGASPAQAGILITPSAGYTISWDGNEALFAGTYVPTNTGLQSVGATAFGSSQYGGVHTIAGANNGLYGNANSWLAASTDTDPQIGIRFRGLTPLTGIAWGRTNVPAETYTDRALGVYTLQYTQVGNPGVLAETGNPATGWATIGTVAYSAGGFNQARRHEFSIATSAGAPIMASGVRVKVPDEPNFSNQIAIDELELYSRSPAVPTAGLSAWLKADQGVVRNASDQVTLWADQSGVGNNATPGNSPTLVQNAWAGMPTVRFAGSVQHLNLPTTGTLGILNSDYEIILVGRSTNTGVQFLTAGGWVNYELHLNGSAGARFIPAGSGSDARYADVGSPGAYTNGRPRVFGVRVEGDTGIIRMAGVDSLDTVTGARSALDALLTLGVRSDASYSFVGDMAEVLVYNRALTPAERASVEQYLNDKWNWAMTHLAETGGSYRGTNVAPHGTPFAKDVIPGYAAHSIAHLNDGRYGNNFSWIGNTANSFAGIVLDKTYDINGIGISRDNTGQLSDRTRGTYTFQYTTDSWAGVNLNDPAQIDALTWHTIGVFDYDGAVPDATPWLRHYFEFERVRGATGVRVLTDMAAGFGFIGLDEIEVNAIPEPSTLVLASLGLLGLALLGRRRRVGQVFNLS